MIYIKSNNGLQLLKVTLFLLTIFVFTAIPTGTNAQSNEKKLIYRMELGSRLFWRGEKYTESPIIQGITGVKNKRFYLATAGVYAFSPHEYHELNFIAEYFVNEQFKIGAIDYFGLTDNINIEHDFLNFKSNTTKHMIDFYFNYSFNGNYPLAVCWSTFLYGPDKNSEGNQRYSSYIEFVLPFERHGHNFSPYIGIAPYSGFYSEKTAVVNAGFKVQKKFIANSNMSLPSEINFILNPYKKKAYISLLIGIQNN